MHKMMGEMFLYRNTPPSELDAMNYTKMRFWHQFHDFENDRIEKENTKIRNKKKRWHPDA